MLRNNRYKTVFRKKSSVSHIPIIYKFLESSNIPVTIVGESNSSQGQIQIIIDNNLNGSICGGNNWDNTDAEVVCRMLGLPLVTALTLS